ARVRKLTLYIDPVGLLLGEVKVGRMVLEGADILVERNEVGDSNLEMLPPPDGSGPHPGENRSLRQRGNPAFPWINTIEIKDSVLTLREGVGRPPVVVEVASATLKASAPNQALQMAARLSAPQAAPLQLTGQAGSFDGWMRGLPGTIDVHGTLGDGKIAIKGSVASKGTNLQIVSEGPDLSVFGPYLHLPLPSGGPYELSAKAATFRNGLKVDIASLKVGSSELMGDALFRPDRHGTPTATINIDAPRLDVGDFKQGAANAAASSPAPGPRRLVPTMPFSASWLGRSHLQLTARVGEIAGLQSKVQNASLSLGSSDKRFSFRGAATVGSGSAGFDLVYDGGGRVGQATLTATASRVSAEDLSTLLGLNLGLRESIVDLDLRLRGNGRTTRDTLNAATGVIEVTLSKGAWPGESLQGFPGDTVKLLGSAADKGVPFNCAAGRFEVSGGVANLRRLVVDTPTATLVGGGYVHLRSEGWEFLLVPEARDNRNIALTVPARVKGGTGRATTATTDAAVSRQIIPAGAVPSLVAQLNQSGRQPNVNPCSAMAPRVDGLRPGLRAQMPTPPAAERRDRRPAQR
ncbi:MAG TPA: AsmA-like C-terminal region-containing protein, partial [Reyranellaceae bacterium]|nr:AsmA-like C-terminal region-containing protein [Reyranellaceae bacterium]